METTAIIMMIIILVLIWGGLAFALRLALHKEKMKNQ